jgi:fumarate hydratase class I
MVKINTPITMETALSLRLGEMVLISGIIYTGRDRLHQYLVRERPDRSHMPFDLEGGIIYHCGPLVKTVDNNTYIAVAAGPTTSMRVDIYTPELIRHYGLRVIMGKGGMGEETVRAMAESGCVYLNTINGAAAYLADRIVAVHGVWKLEDFGPTEALWVLEVRDFPAIVTIDAHGNSLHSQIREGSYSQLMRLFGPN